MKKITYKTNLNCGGCVSKVEPLLNKLDGLDSWSVDTDSPLKILTVEMSKDVGSEVLSLVESIGFDISLLD